jgi:hypothetical protein
MTTAPYLRQPLTLNVQPITSSKKQPA